MEKGCSLLYVSIENILIPFLNFVSFFHAIQSDEGGGGEQAYTNSRIVFIDFFQEVLLRKSMELKENLCAV